MSEKSKEPLFLKVHDAFTYTRFGYPLISKAATAGVIYLIRNPLDVAVSFAHHNASPLERMVRKMGEADFAFVDKPYSLFDQLQQKILTWGGHVTSWVDEPGLRMLVVRYEDLKSDSLAAFSKVIDFCGLEEDPVRIEKAVRFSQFEQAQKQEAEHGFGENLNPEKEFFFRKGQVGSWREELTPAMVRKLIAEHTPVMQRFGYLDHKGELNF